MYLDAAGFRARVGIDFLVGATIGGFPDRIPASDFSRNVTDPILGAVDRAFVASLYQAMQGLYVLRDLTTEEKARYFDLYCVAAQVTRVRDTLIDASAEIDGYLQGRYTLPLQDPPAVLAKYACDLAAYALIGTRRLDEEKDKDFVRRAEAARAYLTKVAEGKIALIPAAPAGHVSGSVQYRTRPRLDLRGY